MQISRPEDLVDKEGFGPELGKVSSFPVADRMKSNPWRVCCGLKVVPEATKHLLPSNSFLLRVQVRGKKRQFKRIVNRQTG